MRNSQAGNAVIFILLGIALFSALAYTFMRSARTGQTNLSAGQAKLAAEEIINYAQNVSNAVDKVRRRGCSENEINFVNDADGNVNANPSAPASGECNVFKPEGGNVEAMEEPPGNWFTSGSPEIFYVGTGHALQDVGTTCTLESCAEVSIYLGELNDSVCKAINKQLGYSFTDIPVGAAICEDWAAGRFDCYSSAVEIAFTEPELVGKTSVCYNWSGWSNVFVHVLEER